MSQIKISDLTETTSVNENLCYVPVDDGTSTKKISLKNLEESGTASAKSYAEAAAASATSASGYATNASTSASNASTYASNAADSATSAAGSASDASGYASTASAAASNASGSANNAALSANSAAQQVASAAASAVTSQSWAEGGTGTRAGEDTNNAKYWAQTAAAMHDGVASFNGRAGAVIPASGDYSASMIGYDSTYNVDTKIRSIDTKIGSTDISGIGDGSITGAISAQNSALANKADASAVTALSGKAYQTDDREESAIDDADYIPFYDSSASAKRKIKVENLNLGGSGGSIITVTTSETDLYGKTVSVTDGTLVFQSTFDNSGNATIEGVTCTGTLTVTAQGTSEIAEEQIEVKYFGNYSVELNFYVVYGFHVDSSVSNSANAVSYQVQYDGENVENYDFTAGYMNFATDTWDWGDWTGDEFFMPKPVLIKQDYSDKIYLNPNDYTKDIDGNDVSAILTGSTDGYNAMMEWGKNGKRIWYKLVPDSTPESYTCFIANKRLDSGFKAWSFYDANNVLGEHFYTSIYNGSTVGSALRSLSGKTPNNTEAGATQITRAKANNKNSEAYAWYIDVYADRVLINLLLILVIKSLNSDVVGYGNYTGGTAASNLLTTGTGNAKGMFYGKQSNAVVKVFGMENWFANCWRRMAGLILNSGALKYKLTYGTADGSSAAGYREDDNAPTNYLTGNSIATNLSSSYIVAETAKTDGSLLPSGFSGANATYYSDACWSSTGIKYALVGGHCGNGSACGAFALILYYALSDSSWYDGCALSLKPLAQ